MSLIKSISGIRGTIGGKPGDNLTPKDIVECTAAFGQWAIQQSGIKTIVVGRDARISGEIVSQLVVNTLLSMGIDVVDLGLSTTPTVEIAVPIEKAGAGIIITASHNPKQWNALKFLNQKGEFISAADGTAVLDLIERGELMFAPVESLGSYQKKEGYFDQHIDMILSLPILEVSLIRQKRFKVVVDAVNSTGAISIPPLLEKLGCTVVLLNGEITGDFAHNPEPLPEHLTELSKSVVTHQADLGIAIDPDVDRLALVCENGDMFGEEYSLVAVADYILSRTGGNTVSNLSSTRALRDITEKHGYQYYAAAVGEVNVVTKMKEVNAVIGGEGNGGIIYPELHYGRDALVGVAFILSLLSVRNQTLGQLKKSYPAYVISKNKMELTPEIDIDLLLQKIPERYPDADINTIDGVKIDFEKEWVHLRKSNTEPIIRIYAESDSSSKANALAEKIIQEMNQIIAGK